MRENFSGLAVKNNTNTKNTSNNTNAKSQSKEDEGVFQVRDRVFKKLLNNFKKMNSTDDVDVAPYDISQNIQNIDFIMEKLVQRVTAIVDNKTKEIEKLILDLYPKDLGKIDIEISLLAEQLVSIVFLTEEPEIRKIFKRKSSELEKNLNEKGIEVKITFKEG